MRKERARFAAVALGLGLLAAVVAPSSAAGPFSFPHRPHLSAAGIAGGSDADCRACHDYAKGGRETHLAGCDRCHVDAEHLEKKVTGAYARPEFQHREHLYAKDGAPLKGVTCLTCHAMRVDSDWIEFTVPTSGLGPRSRGAKATEKTCADCHAAHETSGGLVRQDERTGDGRACAVCHLAETSILPLAYRGDVRPSASKPFAHEDHGGAAADCAACHDAVKTSRTIWDYDPAKGTAEKCAGCHVGAGGAPLVAPSAAKTVVTRIDFSNFPHQKHLGEFSRMTCATCHYPETEEQGRCVFGKRAASAEPVGRAQLVNFKACDACHGHDGWSPGKPSWHVDGHGVGAWACFKCHDGTAGANGKLLVATAEVTRAAIGASRFTAHDHPGITSKGARLADARDQAGGKAKKCEDCHVGDLATLTSRLAARPFAHDPHLPSAPTDADCLRCHTTSATARRSEDLTRFDPHLDAAPAPTGAAAAARGCLVCHVGATAADLGLGEAPAPRRAVQFDHAGHVRAASLVEGERGIACLECHLAGGPAGYRTPADVLDCSKCHAHEGDAAKVARTGPKTSSGDSSKCLFCHDQVRGDANGRVGAPPRETIARSHLELREGKQFHDKTGDCAACHVRDGATAAPYVERIAKAQVRASIHDDPKFADRPFNDPKGDCKSCHRTEPRGYLRSLSGR